MILESNFIQKVATRISNLILFNIQVLRDPLLLKYLMNFKIDVNKREIT